MALRLERFDSRERSASFRRAIGVDAFPPWVIWGDPESDVWWNRVRDWFPEFQIVLIDEDEPIASAWGVPVRWSGAPADLPAGYTDSLRRAALGREQGIEPTALVVCAAVVLPARARTGLATELLTAMRDLPAAAPLAHVIVPIRPTRKASYPLTDIQTYSSWTRADGLPLDPWLRTHIRMGGRVLGTAPGSQILRAPVRQWEKWTGLALPSSGSYIVPGGLAPLVVDRRSDLGTITEDNIWAQHR